MAEKSRTSVIIDGKEIQAISESEMTFNVDTIERDCEITTTKGVVRFKAVFTPEQWKQFVEIHR